MSSQPECVWALGAELGEGPLWSARDEALWFVDIKQARVHRFVPQSGEGRSWNAPSPPGFIAPRAGGGFIAGLKTGLHNFDPRTGEFVRCHEVEPHRPDKQIERRLCRRRRSSLVRFDGRWRRGCERLSLYAQA